MKKKKKNQFNPYATDKFAKIPSWIKVLFLKYWVAAAAIFFFTIGNALVFEEDAEWGDSSAEVLIVFVGLGLALFTEYITKPMIRLMRSSRDDTYRFNLINLTGIKSFLLNLLYAYIILIPWLLILYVIAVNGKMLVSLGDSDTEAMFEPFTAGFVYVFLDAIVVVVKNLIVYTYKSLKYNNINKKNKILIDKLDKMSDEELMAFASKEN